MSFYKCKIVLGRVEYDEVVNKLAYSRLKIMRFLVGNLLEKLPKKKQVVFQIHTPTIE